MEQQQIKIKQETLDELSNEAKHILEILDQIEVHTADLRKKLVNELKPKDNSIHLDLDAIE